MHTAPHSDDHHHAHEPGHTHAHAHDRGFSAALRYATLVRRLWRSPVSDAVVGLVAPKAGETVVEIGSGMGAAAVVAARSGASILAVDPTQFMRGILGARRLLRSGRRRIRVVDGAAESIPAPDGSADAVWTVNTMHHWTDLGRAVTEIQRVMRVGGRLLLVDEDFDDPSHPEHARHGARMGGQHHGFALIDPVDVAGRLQRAGFPDATGGTEQVGGRPCKVVRGVRA